MIGLPATMPNSSLPSVRRKESSIRSPAWTRCRARKPVMSADAPGSRNLLISRAAHLVGRRAEQIAHGRVRVGRGAVGAHEPDAIEHPVEDRAQPFDGNLTNRSDEANDLIRGDVRRGSEPPRVRAIPPNCHLPILAS